MLDGLQYFRVGADVDLHSAVSCDQLLALQVRIPRAHPLSMSEGSLHRLSLHHISAHSRVHVNFRQLSFGLGVVQSIHLAQRVEVSACLHPCS